MDGNVSGFGKLTFSPDNKSFGSVSFSRVDSDNSTPTNEPIVNGRFLHEIEPGFDRLTNFNVPGPTYHQDENRFTVNYQRQFSPWARSSRSSGHRNVDQSSSTTATSSGRRSIFPRTPSRCIRSIRS